MMHSLGKVTQNHQLSICLARRKYGWVDNFFLAFHYQLIEWHRDDFPVIISHPDDLVSFASYPWLDKNFLNFSTWENKVQHFICPNGIKKEFLIEPRPVLFRLVVHNDGCGTERAHFVYDR